MDIKCLIIPNLVLLLRTRNLDVKKDDSRCSVCSEVVLFFNSREMDPDEDVSALSAMSARDNICFFCPIRAAQIQG